MTSLIDVIFLLLLFFMLTSTFSKFSEVELTAAARGSAADNDSPPLFLQLGADDVRLNGEAVALDALPGTLGAETAETPRVLLVALRDGVTAQRLTDLLVALRGIEGLSPTVMGAS
ncbi:outer membrane transport energization protein ExbD [Roseivivax sediminis]|uniref:Outer membrane transport energization protein ExbD n=2 Tax=Roseivivax sediminis TaxID=936889 RepID=A0A1I1V839_9RHOB|nr:outer membrane transport energization protein ExbD [Roseivivax sediminis]